MDNTTLYTLGIAALLVAAVIGWAIWMANKRLGQLIKMAKSFARHALASFIAMVGVGLGVLALLALYVGIFKPDFSSGLIYNNAPTIEANHAPTETPTPTESVTPIPLTPTPTPTVTPTPTSLTLQYDVLPNYSNWSTLSSTSAPPIKLPSYNLTISAIIVRNCYTRDLCHLRVALFLVPSKVICPTAILVVLDYCSHLHHGISAP